MSSIYHFFASLIPNCAMFLSPQPLDDLPYYTGLIAARSTGQFPDMALCLNTDSTLFPGGELIELKDALVYGVSSFNSTIPTGKKPIHKLGAGILAQMRLAGDDPDKLPIRDVYYLVRGRQRGRVKVCLTHGSFFETVPTNELIQRAFALVLRDRLADLDEETKAKIAAAFTEQETFSQTRDVQNASVKLRFRIMTEVKREGNPLNSLQYPQIGDDSLNLIVPIRHAGDARHEVEKMCTALGYSKLPPFRIRSIKHPFNGRFLVFQCPII